MRIVTDTAADLPIDEANALGVQVAPLHITFPEGEISSANLSADDFYRRINAMYPKIPTTSQPSPGVFTEIFQGLLITGEPILSIHISSGLSGTVQSARLAASQMPDSDITVFDSMTLSGGQRFQVLAAVAATKAGWAKDKVLELLRRIQQECEVVFTLVTLDYLARGGRIGRVEALAGTLLQIKPVINVNKSDGKYSTVGKTRTLQRAELMIVDHLAVKYGDRPLWVTVLHGNFAAHAEALLTALCKRLQCVRTETLRVSPVLGVHTGPGVVGVAAVPMSVFGSLF
jgi:DegV family protein with EDD domain